jgi:LEA14-like dessication related protein
MKLKKVEIDIFVDGVKAGRVDQKPGTIIRPNSEFTVPLEVQLHLKEMGLVDTILSFIGGKKHEVQFTGKLKVTISGFPVRIPVDHKEQVKL